MIYKQGILLQPDRAEMNQIEYWATKCKDVKVTTQFADTVPAKPEQNIWEALRGINSVHEQFNQAECLGDTDGVTSDNVDVYNFDYATYVGTGDISTFVNGVGTDTVGSYEKINGKPHIIKLVPDQTNDQFGPTRITSSCESAATTRTLTSESVIWVRSTGSHRRLSQPQNTWCLQPTAWLKLRSMIRIRAWN